MIKELIYSPKTRWWVLFFLLLPALGYTAYGASKGAFEHSCDLQHDWIAGQMVHRGVNPYRVWLEAPESTLDYHSETRCAEILPGIAFLNTPLNAFLMVPFQGIEWETLRVLWVILQIVVTALTAIVAMQLLPQKPRDRYIMLLPVVILFGWYATREILIFGQISMIVTLLTFASLAMMYRGRNVLAGIFLGIALCKFSMIWALPLLFLAYRRFTALAIAIGLQVLGIVLMSIATGDSLFEIPRIYLEILTEWSGQSGGVISLSRWVQEIGNIPEFIVFIPGIALALWLTFGLYRDIIFTAEHDLTSTPERLQATLFAMLLILVSLTFVYHRQPDTVLTLIVVIFWLSLTELPERTATQERMMKIMALPIVIMMVASFLPSSFVGRVLEEAEVAIEAIYTIAMVTTLGIVLWMAVTTQQLNAENDST